MTNIEKIAAILQFYDQHPGLSEPNVPDMVYCWSKEAMLKVARLPGATKSYDDQWSYVTVKVVDDLSIKFFTERYKVCEVIETESVIIPAQPERTIQKPIKWKCHPLLEPTEKESIE